MREVSALAIFVSRWTLWCRYTWSIYAERLVTLSRIYSFWKDASKLQRIESRRYLSVSFLSEFTLLSKPLSEYECQWRYQDDMIARPCFVPAGKCYTSWCSSHWLKRWVNNVLNLDFVIVLRPWMWLPMQRVEFTKGLTPVLLLFSVCLKEDISMLEAQKRWRTYYADGKETEGGNDIVAGAFCTGKMVLSWYATRYYTYFCSCVHSD